MPEMDSYQITEALIRIESKLDNLNTTYHDHLTDHTDHETRIRSLEKRSWSLPATAFILNTVMALCGYLALHH